ncbi:MAG: hypothetical protein ACT4O1_04065 [Gemmatimonadota bacterium]
MSAVVRQRVERIIVAVLRQTFAAARTVHFTLIGDGADARFAAALCELAGASPGPGLTVAGASKTALLLGTAGSADVLPLGDLYHSQLVVLIGAVPLPPVVAELAHACGGAETLDHALQRFFDERRDWAAATNELAPAARHMLEHQLDAARFRRARVGIVPKLGARTLGIDLYA